MVLVLDVEGPLATTLPLVTIPNWEKNAHKITCFRDIEVYTYLTSIESERSNVADAAVF